MKCTFESIDFNVVVAQVISHRDELTRASDSYPSADGRWFKYHLLKSLKVLLR